MDKSKLLAEILGPLLDDYHYWFDRSQKLLEQQQLSFITPEQQADVLERVRQAQGELQAAESLYRLSEQEVGIDPGLMAKWHRLLMECAELGYKYRQIHPSTDR